MLKILDLSRKLYYPYRNISTKVPLFKEPKRKVKETVELVTLVDQNDRILGLKAKTESEKLARKLNLTLERVYDTKYGKTYPAYKMMSAADLLKEEKQISTAKVLKKLPINYLITDNDLMTKIKIIKKWLCKDYEVHIHIMGNSEAQSRMKNVFAKMEEELKTESRMLNIRHKEDGIKFIAMQPKQVKQAETAADSKKKDDTPSL
ncbi:uncharacterized protein LOC129225097 [Uloborus diversus]|uniref:uncharacterized protein LOC129225097 n=1 Tax=Uloborus diversus TaxID=327109 RepID=UPI00240A0082|nr:uncharacterized protein LOC129225097 [Uloborus diversus]